MPNIFDIESELVRIAEAFDQLEGQEETPEILAAVEAYFGELLGDRDRKIDGYCRLISDFYGKAKIKKAEADRIAAMAKADQAAGDRLKARLKMFMEAAEVTRLEGSFHKVAIQQNGGVAPLVLHPHIAENPNLAPDWAKLWTVTLDSDKVRAKIEANEAEIQTRLVAYRQFMVEDGSWGSALESHCEEEEARLRAELPPLNFATIGARGTHVRIR